MTLIYEELLGQPWAYDTADCFALCRKFYQLNWGIELPDIAHPPLWEVKNPELDLIRMNFTGMGFEAVDVTPRTAMVGDALLMQVGANVRVLNHCAVYIGAGAFIHQPFRCVGRKDLWAGEWRNATLVVARHPAVPQSNYKPSMDLMNLVPPSVARRFDGR